MENTISLIFFSNDDSPYSNACSIDLGQSVVITGGYKNGRKVTEYNEDGKTRELPELIRSRDQHGCGSYVDQDDNVVSRHNLKEASCNCNYRFYW